MVYINSYVCISSLFSHYIFECNRFLLFKWSIKYKFYTQIVILNKYILYINNLLMEMRSLTHSVAYYCTVTWKLFFSAYHSSECVSFKSPSFHLYQVQTLSLEYKFILVIRRFWHVWLYFFLFLLFYSFTVLCSFLLFCNFGVFAWLSIYPFLLKIFSSLMALYITY